PSTTGSRTTSVHLEAAMRRSAPACPRPACDHAGSAPRAAPRARLNPQLKLKTFRISQYVLLFRPSSVSEILNNSGRRLQGPERARSSMPRPFAIRGFAWCTERIVVTGWPAAASWRRSTPASTRSSDYFGRCLEQFGQDPKLGIGGGVIFNRIND